MFFSTNSFIHNCSVTVNILLRAHEKSNQNNRSAAAQFVAVPIARDKLGLVRDKYDVFIIVIIVMRIR